MPLFSSSDLISARQRIERHAWAAEIFAAVSARADAWLANPARVPALAGGWIHDYVCPEHWNALTFDPGSPHTHRCLFGEMHTGEKLDAAWRVAEHRRIANTARDLGLVYAMSGDARYADAALAILAQYADAYREYAGAGEARDWMLKGRVFNQALTEALWAIPILHTYDLVRAALTREQDARIADGLLRPLAETMTTAQDQLVCQEKNLKSNYNAWLIAVLGLLGYALDDKTLVARALDSDAGFCAHLGVAILPDGFEYEGTPYYHNFVALAYTILAEAARANGRDLYAVRGAQGQSIELMWRALASLAYADGTMPAINDGAYQLGGAFTAEISETYEIALARTHEPVFAWLLDRTLPLRGAAERFATKQSPLPYPPLDKGRAGVGLEIASQKTFAMTRAARDAWSALIFGERDIANAPMPRRTSVCLQPVGIAVLRDDANAQEVCVPFGAYAGSHSHLDRLAAQIFPWSTDPGTPLYGVAARATWYQQTAAHNVVIMDGKSQAQCGSKLLNWITTPDSTMLWLDSDSLYPGVRASRLLMLADGVFKDSFLLEADSEHTFDWLLHVDGDCNFNGVTSDAEAKVGEGTYQFLTRTAHRDAATRFQFTVRHNDQNFRVTLSCEIPFDIIIARSPAHVATPTQPRQTIMMRAYTRRINFVATSELIR
ncbi:MAG: alginate lyase family protein [Chloroflexi bacterium]|nr:alginate lyase family protein [Chloroflexota bacterium]